MTKRSLTNWVTSSLTVGTSKKTNSLQGGFSHVRTCQTSHVSDYDRRLHSSTFDSFKGTVTLSYCFSARGIFRGWVSRGGDEVTPYIVRVTGRSVLCIHCLKIATPLLSSPVHYHQVIKLFLSSAGLHQFPKNERMLIRSPSDQLRARRSLL